MRIDAHQHFWTLARGDYGWLTPRLAPLYRDFGPADLAPLLQHAGIGGTIVVQAAPTVAETLHLLSLAQGTPFVRGVVGWADFEADDAPEKIAQLAEHEALAGLRPMIHNIADPDWMLRDDLTPAFEAMIAHDLTFDALTRPQHLVRLERLVARHPRLRVVIDHGSKPAIADGAFTGWADDMARIAAESDAWCKLSGLVTEARPDWTTDDLKPYVDHLLTVFGPHRLVWGSDWPVCTLASTYERWLETSEALLAGLDANERAAVFGGNAARAYQLRNDIHER